LLRSLPPFDRDLSGSRDGQFTLRDIFRDRRAGARICVRPNLDRSDEHRTRTDESVVTDLGAPLIGAVVVYRDGARTDVDLSSDGRVPEIGQVVRLAARSD